MEHRVKAETLLMSHPGNFTESNGQGIGLSLSVWSTQQSDMLFNIVNKLQQRWAGLAS